MRTAERKTINVQWWSRGEYNYCNCDIWAVRWGFLYKSSLFRSLTSIDRWEIARSSEEKYYGSIWSVKIGRQERVANPMRCVSFPCRWLWREKKLPDDFVTSKTDRDFFGSWTEANSIVYHFTDDLWWETVSFRVRSLNAVSEVGKSKSGLGLKSDLWGKLPDLDLTWTRPLADLDLLGLGL